MKFSEDDLGKKIKDLNIVGTSVLAIKTEKFLIIAADTTASYGHMTMLNSFSRISQINKKTLLAASGKVSDFQNICEKFIKLNRKDWLLQDGYQRSPREWHNYLTRICYAKRIKVKPLLNEFIIGGIDNNGETYLGYTDMYGTHFKENYICTGLGENLALPLIRKEYRKHMSKQEVVELLKKCMRILYYRDCKASKYFLVCKIDKDGFGQQKFKVQPDWSIASNTNN